MLKIMLYTFLCFVCRNLFAFCMVAGSLVYGDEGKKTIDRMRDLHGGTERTCVWVAGVMLHISI